MWGQTEPSPGKKWAGKHRWRRAECAPNLSVKSHSGAPSLHRNDNKKLFFFLPGEDLTPLKNEQFQRGHSQFVRTAAWRESPSFFCSVRVHYVQPRASRTCAGAPTASPARTGVDLASGRTALAGASFTSLRHQDRVWFTPRSNRMLSTADGQPRCRYRPTPSLNPGSRTAGGPTRGPSRRRCSTLAVPAARVPPPSPARVKRARRESAKVSDASCRLGCASSSSSSLLGCARVTAAVSTEKTTAERTATRFT